MGRLSEAISKEPDDINAQLAAMDADGRVALLRRENKKLARKLRERDSGADVVKAAFIEAYSDSLDIAVPEPPKREKKKTVEEALLHLTDVHFGKETETYSSTVAAERLLRVGHAVAEIVELRRAFARIDRLQLLLGGDFVEGEGEIFGGQAHEIDQDLVEQMIKFGPERVAQLILFLLQVFPTIHISGVPGNHGRHGKDTAKRNNYDSIFYEVVRLIVKAAAPKQLKRLTWNLPLDRAPGTEWYAHFNISERWGGLLVHGDQVKGMLGFPWYGWGKKVGGWAACLPPFDYLFGGHFHTDAAFDIHGRRVLATGSTESDNAYAKESFAAAGSPKQRFCAFNERYGLLADHQLHLEEREPKR